MKRKNLRRVKGLDDPAFTRSRFDFVKEHGLEGERALNRGEKEIRKLGKRLS